MKNKFILLKKNSNRPDKVRVYDTRSNFSFTLINIKVIQGDTGHAKSCRRTFAMENKKKISTRA